MLLTGDFLATKTMLTVGPGQWDFADWVGWSQPFGGWPAWGAPVGATEIIVRPESARDLAKRRRPPLPYTALDCDPAAPRLPVRPAERIYRVQSRAA